MNLKTLKNYIGYRTEELYGSGVRDMLQVTDYEIDELGNIDIQMTLNLSKKKTKYLLKKLYQQGYTKSIWLCDSAKILCECYGVGYDIDKYKIKEGIILSDLKKEGKLIAYKERDLK
jgi:hypothetical protein